MYRRWFAAALFLFAFRDLAVAEAPINPDEGRPQVQWQDAKQIIGKQALVNGKCINVNTLGSGITFVNFDDKRPARFAGVIFKDDLGNFPKNMKELYVGKILRLRGTVSVYQGNSQIVLKGPDQIEVLDSMPPSTLPDAAARRTPKPGQLSIAAYNVLNLFDEYDDPYKADEGTPAKPRDQLQHLAQSIAALDADVIAMEEVENRDYLQRFVDVFLPDLGYENVMLFEGNDGRGIDVGLISRVPIGEVRSRRHLKFDGPDGPMSFMRDVPAVTLLPPGGQPIEIWCVHLKSNSGGREFTEATRVAEAKEVRLLLDQSLAKDPNARIVVTGDFNDTPGTPTLKTIIGEGPTALWSAASDLKDPKTITYNEGDFKSMIDFMLCSPAMMKQYVKGSFQVPQGSVETTGSDHNPINAVFKTN